MQDDDKLMLLLYMKKLIESMGIDMLENMVGLLTNNNIAIKLFCSCIELCAL